MLKEVATVSWIPTHSPRWKEKKKLVGQNVLLNFLVSKYLKVELG